MRKVGENKPRAYSIVVEPVVDTDPDTPVNEFKFKDRCSSGRKTETTAAVSEDEVTNFGTPYCKPNRSRNSGQLLFERQCL